MIHRATKDVASFSLGHAISSAQKSGICYNGRMVKSTSVPAAPTGFSLSSTETLDRNAANTHCPHCDQCVTVQNMRDLASTGRFVICAWCGDEFTLHSATVSVDPECAHLFGPSAHTAIRSATWLHVSDVPPEKFRFGSTHESQNLDVTHVGTMPTVDEVVIQDHLGLRASNAPLYLYEFLLADNVLIAPEVIDRNDWDGEVEDLILGQGYGVVPYLNRYEGVGQVSLLVNPSYLVHFKCEEWTPDMSNQPTPPDEGEDRFGRYADFEDYWL